jgi:predicted NBD/HSP70 family sugar kinase
VGRLATHALRDHVLGAIAIDNDINFAALGEAAHGAAAGVDDFFYLSLGSGVGGAIVIDGRVRRGTHGFAGEIGHLPIATPAGLRPLESVVGRLALEELAHRNGLLEPGRDVFHLLEDPAAEAWIGDHVVDVLAIAIASIASILDPSRIILGGGVGRYSDRWIERIRERLTTALPVLPDLRSTAVGEDASLLGTISLGRELARAALLERWFTA